MGQWLAAAVIIFAAASVMAAPNSPKSPAKGQPATKAAPASPKAGEHTFAANAPYAILMEAESGVVLFEKNSDQLIAPASLSKLMTAEFVFNEIKQGRLKTTDELPVSVNAWRKGGAPSRTSTMFAAVQSRVAVEDLLQGVIIQSANDACIVFAEALAGTEDQFAEKLTTRAREIGLATATFGNSNGLPHPKQLMTVRELAVLARHIIATYPEFYRIYGETEFTFNKIRQLNRNPLLAMNIGADGMKTGFTKEAGYGIVGSAQQNGLRLIVVLNGLKTEKERADEAKKMLEWGFNTFQTNFLFAEGAQVAEAKIYGGEKHYVPLILPRAVKLMVPRNSRERITARVTYSGPVPAPVQKGQTIGRLKIWRGDAVVLEVPVQAAEDVAQGALHRRAWDAASELVIGVVRASMPKL
jgi:D-alanyl-D-alanine carboxypeptidase (penicillin-binding protein 5/6)